MKKCNLTLVSLGNVRVGTRTQNSDGPLNVSSNWSCFRSRSRFTKMFNHWVKSKEDVRIIFLCTIPIWLWSRFSQKVNFVSISLVELFKKNTEKHWLGAPREIVFILSSCVMRENQICKLLPSMHLPDAEGDMLLITDSCKLFQQYLLCSMTSPQYARAWQTSFEWNCLCSGFP